MSTPNEPSSSGNVFTRKLGPLPMWAWMGIALVLAVGYHFYSKSKSSSTTAQTSATNNTPGGVDSSLVPQFINQTYVNGSPPLAPNISNSYDTDSNNTGANAGGTTTVNNINPPAPKPVTPAPTVHYVKYTVHAGDTLQSLAKKYGVTVEQIASAPGNVYVSGEVPGNKKVGQQLGTGAGLKTGMTLNIPQYSS